MSNFRQYFNNVRRYHGVPVYPVGFPCNIVNALRGREVSGPIEKQRILNPSIYTSIVEERMVMASLNETCCILFDHIGHRFITAGLAQPIQVWSTYTNSKICTLRSDFRVLGQFVAFIAINRESTLLAVGRFDGIIDVWNIKTFNFVVRLKKHKRRIRNISFSPMPCRGINYMASVCTDGTVLFWTYIFRSKSKVEVKYRNDRVLCAKRCHHQNGSTTYNVLCFSPEGSFVAIGSNDDLRLSIYDLRSDEGPRLTLSIESSVECIQWGNSSLRILNADIRGGAVIWTYENDNWKKIQLDVELSLTNGERPQEVSRVVLQTVCWNASDQFVMAAIKSNINIWNSNNGRLVKVLSGHMDTILLLEAHPYNNNIILSVGKDLKLLVWNIYKGEQISTFYFYYWCFIENDFKFVPVIKLSPDGCVLVRSTDNSMVTLFQFLGRTRDDPYPTLNQILPARA